MAYEEGDSANAGKAAGAEGGMVPLELDSKAAEEGSVGKESYANAEARKEAIKKRTQTTQLELDEHRHGAQYTKLPQLHLPPSGGMSFHACKAGCHSNWARRRHPQLSRTHALLASNMQVTGRRR